MEKSSLRQKNEMKKRKKMYLWADKEYVFAHNINTASSEYTCV